MTTNTAQGITSTEHIFVTPRGAQTTDGRRSDVSDWRHRERDYWLTSEGAEKQEVVNRRPLGDPRPVGAADLWMNWAATSAELPEKLNATDLVREAGATRHRHLWPGWHAWSRAATQTPCDDNWSGAAFIAKPPQAGWFDAFVAGNRQVQHGVARLSTVAAAVHKAVAMQRAHWSNAHPPGCDSGLPRYFVPKRGGTRTGGRTKNGSKTGRCEPSPAAAACDRKTGPLRRAD